MDDRQHADLANNIRDAIKETWPNFADIADMSRLRTVISQEIGKSRTVEKDHPLPYSQVNIESFIGYNGFLSNFYWADFDVQGITYPTTEHYYQGMKTMNLQERQAIRNAATPGAAKRLGQKCDMRPDWDKVKLQIMEDALCQKFLCDPMRQKLIDTGTRELIEGNTWGDTFWGVCDGKGENHLGKLLMKIRAGLF